MCSLSTADRTVSPPLLSIPRDYNAAFDLLESNLRAGRGAKVAYIDDNGSYTYNNLTTRVKQFAHALGRLGIEPEQRVLVCLQDTIDFPVAFLGSIWAGVIPVAVNTGLETADYQYLLEDSRARAIVVSDCLLPIFEPILSNVPPPRAGTGTIARNRFTPSAADGPAVATSTTRMPMATTSMPDVLMTC
jgi:benzoate-CoA ligase